MEQVWHELTNLESRDLVFESFKKRHGREPNASRINEIAAAFIQGREYFESAKAAAITVRPLLQYYGVISLSKGLVLMMQSAKGAEALKPAHGLSVDNWKEVLSKGLDHIADLSVTICQGTFHELLEATSNKAYLRDASSAPVLAVGFPVPAQGSSFTLLNVAEALPDAAADYRAWRGNPHPSVKIHDWEVDEAGGMLRIRFDPHLGTENLGWYKDQFKGLATFQTDETWLSGTMPMRPGPLFGEASSPFLGMGDISMIKPLSGSRISPIGVYFAASYFLGMLVRYYPSTWIALGRQQRGDRVSPLLRRMVSLVQKRFPEMVLEFLSGPYDFEQKPPLAAGV